MALSGEFADVWLPAASVERTLESKLEALAKDKTPRAQLRVYFPCASMTSLSAMGVAFTAWPTLGRIELDASSSLRLSDVSALEGLEQCERLHFLALSFAHCSQLRDIRGLARGLGARGASLRHLELNFSWCSALS